MHCEIQLKKQHAPCRKQPGSSPCLSQRAKPQGPFPFPYVEFCGEVLDKDSAIRDDSLVAKSGPAILCTEVRILVCPGGSEWLESTLRVNESNPLRFSLFSATSFNSECNGLPSACDHGDQGSAEHPLHWEHHPGEQSTPGT